MTTAAYVLTGIGVVLTVLSAAAMIRRQLKSEVRALRFYTKFRPASADRYRLRRPDAEPTDY